MTALLAPMTVPSISPIGAPRLLAGVDVHGSLDHHAHLSVHGPRPSVDLARLLALLDASGLTGRGGGGFPFAAKVRSFTGPRRAIIVNGAESEPASMKDRVLMTCAPHLVIDGALAVGQATGTGRVMIAVHDGGAEAALRRALAQRSDTAAVTVHRVGGGFVGGEAHALLRGLRGGPSLPSGRQDRLTGQGYLLSNAETFAQLAILLRLGPRRFADTGTRTEPGTMLLTVGGAVKRPGVIELPLGTPLGIVLSAVGAGPVQAVVTGGYHGSWLAPIPQIHLSRAGLAAAGGTLGAGVLLVVDDRTCALGELSRVASWLADRSAGQCGPCRFGLPALAADARAVAEGAPSAVGAAFGHARVVSGRGACHHPDGAARFVTSGLHLLHDEVDTHARDGGCGRPVLNRLPLAGGAS